MQWLVMTTYQLKLLFKNRVALLATLLLPLVLTYFFSQLGTRSEHHVLLVGDADQSTYSKQLITRLEHRYHFTIVGGSESELKSKMNGQTDHSALFIHEGFGKKLLADGAPDMHLVKGTDAVEGSLGEKAITEAYAELKQIVQTARYAANELSSEHASREEVFKNIYDKSVSEDTSDLSISLMSHTLGGTESGHPADPTLRSLLGFLVLFLWLVVVQGYRTFIADKENNTFIRMLSTPVSPISFLLAKFISVYVYGLIHIVVTLVAGKLLFRLAGFDRIVLIFVALAMYLFAIAGITFICALYAKSQQLFTALGMPLVMLTGMLGGTFFPMEVAPEWLQVVSRATPQGWVMPVLSDLNATDAALQVAGISGAFIVAGMMCIGVSLFVMNKGMNQGSL